jgi:hypothetical protein
MTIQANFPAIKPSLLLDFANTKQLDSRITYTRASTASFYNGVTTAKAEENLWTYSQTFTNGIWNNVQNATITDNASTAPDGTSTAGLITATANLAQISRINVSGNYTFSFYLKRKTGTGAVKFRTETGGDVTLTITSDWARYSYTETGTGSSFVGVKVDVSGDEVYLWGAQIEVRSTASAYTATTTQAITNYIPVLQTAASGVARFDNNPTTSESLGLLIEEQRTNLFTYSSDFSNAAWVQNQVTINSNIAIAPDGTLTAEKIVSTASTNDHYVYSGQSVTGPYTVSVYAKAAENGFIAIYSGANWTWFNLTTGAVGTVASGQTASIVSVGNGWYRCFVNVPSGTYAFHAFGPTTSNGSSSSTGNAWNGIYLWGAQLEAASFATSYIPTVASQVTRAADKPLLSGTNFSNFWNMGEGTIFVDVAGRLDNRIFWARDSAAGNYGAFTAVLLAASGAFNSQVQVGSVSQVATNTANTTTALTNCKGAFAYKVNDFASSLNAGTVVTDTSGILSTTLNEAEIGWHTDGAYLNGTIKKLAYYPIRLTNAQIQALTS